MSKSILTIASTSIVSMLAGVALTLAFTAEALETLPDGSTDPLQDVVQEMRISQARLERMKRVVQRELAATRRDFHDTLSAYGGAGTSRPTPGGAAGETVAAVPAPAAHVSRDEAGPSAGKDLQALGPLSGWRTDADVRAEWLFATEERSLRSFGTPDEVAVRGTSEWWTYWNVRGDAIASEYRLKFNNGRLVEASRVQWKKPRSLPTAER
jgi:hypothetical protein